MEYEEKSAFILFCALNEKARQPGAVPGLGQVIDLGVPRRKRQLVFFFMT